MRKFVLLVFLFGSPVWAQSRVEFAALTDSNQLLLFADDALSRARTIDVVGLDARALGIDLRPADGKLYAITQSSTLYTLTLGAGSATATRVARLGTAFNGGMESGFDFNPQADRLRLTALGGHNLRINVDVGAVAVDGALAYASDDRNAGKRPAIVGSAYTNSMANARVTVLFNIDHALDALVKQDPPNDGVLVTVGRLGIDCGAATGFDMAPNGRGGDRAFAGCNGRLYEIDIKTGAARDVGVIAMADARPTPVMIGLAILSNPNPNASDSAR